MFSEFDPAEVMDLVSHCAPTASLSGADAFSLGDLNRSIARSVEQGWRSLTNGAKPLELDCRPPRYLVSESVVGRFASVWSPSEPGYVTVCLVRGLTGDHPAPPLVLSSKKELFSLAWDVGMAFSMRPSRRPEAVMAVFGKRLASSPPVTDILMGSWVKKLISRFAAR